MTEKKLILGMLVLSGMTLAQNASSNIYPHVALPKEEIVKRSIRLTEDEKPIMNVFEMEKKGLNEGEPVKQPWSGSFWPLNKGMIAANYSQDRMWQLKGELLWKPNYNEYVTRREGSLTRIDEWEEWEIDLLSPAEKYDIALGDKSFNLTDKIWDYASRWGSEKQNAFVTAIDLPAGGNWELAKKNDKLGLWEGICHGWATAAGHYPRPEKSVKVKIPGTNKKITFYPTDIKALVSLLWANSLIQDNVIMEGLRCKEKQAKKDRFGRYIDDEVAAGDDALMPRCADVHPGIMHIILANVTGLQKRSFVVDVKAEASVSNQPVSGYWFQYFNPRNGNFYGLEDSIISRAEYGDKDPFRSARHKDTKYIVGVQTTLYYTDWERPHQTDIDGDEYDKIEDKTFNYDLELDENYNIIGGQWRSTRTSKPAFFMKPFVHTNQPDFFWIVPKNWKTYFNGAGGVENWENKKEAVPASWLKSAEMAHSFIYQQTKEFGWNEKCKVTNGSSTREVPCDLKYPRPQPLQKFVDALVEMSQVKSRE